MQKENRQQTPAEIYNSSEAIHNRENVKKEINSKPRPNYSKAFQKDDKERGEFLTERGKWRKGVKNLALASVNNGGPVIGKRNVGFPFNVRIVL